PALARSSSISMVTKLAPIIRQLAESYGRIVQAAAGQLAPSTAGARLARLSAPNSLGLDRDTPWGQLAKRLSRLPLIPVDTQGRIGQSSLTLPVDTWIDGDGAVIGLDAPHGLVYGLPLGVEHAVALVVGQLPDPLPVLGSQPTGSLPEVLTWLRANKVRLVDEGVAFFEAQSVVPAAVKDRLVAASYAVDTRAILTRGVLDDGRVRLESVPIRDIRTMVADRDTDGLAEAVELIVRYRRRIAGGGDWDDNTLDTYFPIGDALAPWNASNDGALRGTAEHDLGTSSLSLLRLDASHPANVLAPDTTLRAARSWAATASSAGDLLTHLDAFERERRWLETWLAD